MVSSFQPARSQGLWSYSHKDVKPANSPVNSNPPSTTTISAEPPGENLVSGFLIAALEDPGKDYVSQNFWPRERLK
jgi:hypothetical protein